MTVPINTSWRHAIRVAFQRLPATMRRRYTCRLLRRLDVLAWRLKGPLHVEWSTESGVLVQVHPSGSRVELRSVWPGWMYQWSCRQNRHPWIWKLLNV